MNRKKTIIFWLTLAAIAGFYFMTKNLSSDFLGNLDLPLPVFTFVIAIVDGFNPCNLFIMTMLLSLILSESHSRKRIFAVGYSFVSVIYIFYFLFMIAWLNIFKYIGFITPLRIFIGILAVVAGLINCKEYFFYRRGITLMVQDRQIGSLKGRIRKVANMMKSESMPVLIGASITLAIFSSLVELPCTAGFPIIYTGVLTGMSLSGFAYYGYILLYNLFYVFPLVVIITLLGYTFKGKQIEKTTMAIIKFIGGAIMLLLGIVLLVNPSLIGI